MIELHTFGRLELKTSEGQEVRAVLVHPKRAALLAYLAVAQPRGFQRRDSLLALFWPELDQDRARASLRKAIHHLRRALGQEAVEGRGDEEVRMADCHLWCDAAAFEAALDRGERVPALEWYQGLFLDAFFVPDAPEFERWMERERSRLHRRAFDAAWEIAEIEERNGSTFGAAYWARRAAALAPDDEGALRRLMTMLDRLGDRTGAVQGYEEFVRRVKADLDIEPSAETQALARSIRVATTPVPGEDAPVPAPDGGPSAHPPAEPSAAASPPPSRPRFRPLAIAAAAVVIAAGSWSGLRTSRGAVGTSPQVVAVFPFQVLGDPSLDYLKEGLPALLSTGMDGAGDIRSVDPYALEGAFSAGDREKGIGPERAGSLALSFGAGFFVLGDLVGTGRQVRINATLYDVRHRGTAVATARSEGPTDSLFALVDHVAARLIAAQRGDSLRSISRLAALTTHSIPALKAYLEGERQFRRGAFSRAIAGYQYAIALDSSFALAWYRLAQAYTWSQVDSSRYAAEQAVRFGERLPAPERELIEAFLLYDRGEADQAELRYREILRRRPEEVDASFSLGEVLFHYNGNRGREVGEARPYFEKALVLNAGDAPLIHLLEIAALERDYATFESLMPGVQPESHFWMTGRMVHAFQLGSEKEKGVLQAELALASDRELATVSAHALFLVEDAGAAERVVRLLNHPSRPAELRLLGHTLLAHLYASAGRLRKARQELDSARMIDPLSATEHAGLLHSVPLLPVSLATLDQMRRDLDQINAPGSRAQGLLHTGVENLHPDLLVYLRGVLDARLGRFTSAISHAGILEEAKGRPDSLFRRSLAGGVRASVGMLSNQPRETVRGLGEIRWSPAGMDRVSYSPFASLNLEKFLRAEALLREGKLEEALGWLGSYAEHSAFGRVYLSPALFRRGEILEQLGRSGEAAAAYQRFAQLWRNADPEFQPMVTEARRQATRLAGAIQEGN